VPFVEDLGLNTVHKGDRVHKPQHMRNVCRISGDKMTLPQHPHRRLAMALWLAALGFCNPLLAQTPAAFPNKAITMVVPFPPGGVADIVARPVAEAMARELGQPVVIENKPSMPAWNSKILRSRPASMGEAIPGCT
jgi:hypothetical protein